MVIDQSNNVYFGYCDNNMVQNKLSVKKRDGASRSIIANRTVPCSSIDMKVNQSGHLYVLYDNDSSNNNRLSLQKWDGSNWTVIQTGMSS
jgi:ribosomal protein L33